jgi:putative glutamine amidotransferase
MEQQYEPAHEIELVEGGLLHKIAGSRRISVNSLHSQGVERLAPRLVTEATAEDGVIEAFRIDGARSFALAVQWHPEWKVMENPFSRALFAAFGQAGREHASRRSR